MRLNVAFFLDGWLILYVSIEGMIVYLFCLYRSWRARKDVGILERGKPKRILSAPEFDEFAALSSL